MHLSDILHSVLNLLGVSSYVQSQIGRVLEYSVSQDSVDPEVSARLPVTNPTHAYWTHSTPDANPLAGYGSDGQLTKDADVCIIGSGITGVGAAYHLSQLWIGKDPLKTVVFEARDFCSGATGRNGGHLTPYMFQHFRAKEAALGSEEAKKGYLLEHYTVDALLKIIRENGLEDQVDLVSGGHLSLYETRLLERVARRDYFGSRAVGVNVSAIEWLNVDDVWMQYGTDHPASRGPGHNVWPLKLVTELFRLANSSNALDLHLHTRTPVTSITALVANLPKDSTLPRRWVLNTPRGTTTCSHVITASNAYAPALHPSLRGETGIVPVRAQIIATRATIAAKDMSMASWDSDTAYWFPRPETDRRTNPLIIIGGAREFSPTNEWNIVDDATVNEGVGAELRKYLPDNFPGMYVHGQEPEMEWTGIMGYTQVGDPFVGPVRDTAGSPIPGQWIAAGFSGHGMPRTFASAEAVAQMIVANVSGVEWTPPAWFPKHFLRWPPSETPE